MADLLGPVREVATGFEVFGELGRRNDRDIWFLGRNQAGSLVALRLRQTGEGPGGEPEFDLEVEESLSGKVPMGTGACPTCGASLRRWGRFCTECGGDLSGIANRRVDPERRDALLAEVRAAAAESFEVLGEMPWADADGTVFFALERGTNRLTRLRLVEDDDGVYLKQTAYQGAIAPRLSTGFETQYLTAVPPPTVPEPPPEPPVSSPAPPPPTPPALHPGARALRRVGFILAVFTLPMVLMFSDVIPTSAEPSNTVLVVGLIWMFVGVFGPPLVLYWRAGDIGEYLDFFPRVQLGAAGVLGVAGVVLLGFGAMVLLDPTIRGRKGAPFYVGFGLLYGGWRLYRRRRGAGRT